MIVEYDTTNTWGVHSVWFKKEEGEYRNSYRDFRLFPKNRNKLIISSPDLINEEILGTDSSKDWYDILSATPPLKKAQSTFDFYVVSEYVNGRIGTGSSQESMWSEDYNWVDEYQSLIDYFDGSIFYIWLNDDPYNVAIGRVYISSWNSPSSGLSEVSLTYAIFERRRYIEFTKLAYYSGYRLIDANIYIPIEHERLKNILHFEISSKSKTTYLNGSYTWRNYNGPNKDYDYNNDDPINGTVHYYYYRIFQLNLSDVNKYIANNHYFYQKVFKCRQYWNNAYYERNYIEGLYLDNNGLFKIDSFDIVDGRDLPEKINEEFEIMDLNYYTGAK